MKIWLFIIFVLISVSILFIFQIKREIIIRDPIIETPLPESISEKTEPFINKGLVSDGIEVILNQNKILLKEGGGTKDVLPIAYQAKEGAWFQTPTGRYTVGEKNEKKISSLVGLSLPYAIQIYEDFFIHQIPIGSDGKEVSSNYTGGCIRLIKEYAKKLFDFAKTGMSVVIYSTTENLKPKESFPSPVDLDSYWIRQKFNNPIRHFYNYGGDLQNISLDYYQHTGIDLAPYEGADLSIYSVSDGTIVGIWRNKDDHGLGNTIIIDNGEFFSLYAHLSEIKKNIGDNVRRGENIGIVGNSGNGCDYWRIGEDGCDSINPPDIHLHFEIKEKPTLENPIGNQVCENKDGSKRFCYGYTPDSPKRYGYSNPLEKIFDKVN